MVRRLAACAVLAVVTGAPRERASAEPVPGFDLERLTFHPGGVGSLVLGSGGLLPAGGFRLALVGHYQKDPLVLVRDGSEVGAVVEDRWNAHVVAAVGLTSWLELGIQAPYLLSQSGQDLRGLAIDPPATSALGTPWASVRAGLLSERRAQPLDLSLGVLVGLPVGQQDALARDDDVSVIPSLGLGKRVAGVRLGAEGALHLRHAKSLSSGGGRDEVGRTLLVGAGITTLGEVVRAELLGRGLLALGEHPHAFEILGALRLSLGRWVELFALGGPGMGRAPGTPELRVAVGIALVRPEGHDPERCSGSELQTPDDCPELDHDGDGIRNRDDACPTKPEDPDAFEDADGCPDLDNDKDGVPDASDRCPSVPGEKRFHGCPRADVDQDGVTDADDACPSEPGPADRRGCPVRDKDKDGVEDKDDDCVEQPGPRSNKGCPVDKKKLVEVTNDRLVIFEKVFFDTNKATIQVRSYPLLDEVARVLREHPEIASVDVEGHTDSRGSKKKNMKLSQARAASVVAYLVGKGIDAGRLVAKGYGPTRPIETNRTKRGRDNNRRVEFVIQSRGQQP